jgi:hypothetical protein
MASTNKATKSEPIFTGGGAQAVKITPLQELIRLTMACMLWEDNFYESGVSAADRIKALVHTVTLQEAAQVAIEARDNMKLRHVPLLIVREMARHPNRCEDDKSRNYTGYISQTLAHVIQRADELSEFLAIYWKDGKQPLSKQVKLGLAKAFSKFDEFQLARYNRDKDVKLRDVLFLCHSKPKDVTKDAMPWDRQTREHYARIEREMGRGYADKHVADHRPEGFSNGELLYGKLVYDQLKTPDTWETELSAGKDKAETFKRLMAEGKLGDLAFLRNLRNMVNAGVSMDDIVAYGDTRKWGRVLPFRFIAAAQVVPQLEPWLERWMLKCLEGVKKLPGRSLFVFDTSGSMGAALSEKSELTRLKAAAALAILARELCEDPTIYCTAGNDGTRVHSTMLIPPRRGFALSDYISGQEVRSKIGGGGIFLTQCMEYIASKEKEPFDRVIVFTDEQDCDTKLKPEHAKMLGAHNYMVNVATHRNGIGYRKWLHIDGFSESVLDYIAQHEQGLGG